MAISKQPVKPRWLSRLKRRAAKIDTAKDWLRVLLQLKRWLVAYKRIPEVEMDESTAIMTRAGNIGQVGVPYDLFIANLSAPDGVLKKQFDDWLAAKRREVPSPVRKRGPLARADEFGEDQFGRWRDLRIVEYGALLIWRERLPEAERRLVTLTLIGEWTGRYGSNDRKRTMDALKDAMKKLPALAAQAGSEMSAKLAGVSGAD